MPSTWRRRIEVRRRIAGQREQSATSIRERGGAERAGRGATSGRRSASSVPFERPAAARRRRERRRLFGVLASEVVRKTRSVFRDVGRPLAVFLQSQNAPRSGDEETASPSRTTKESWRDAGSVSRCSRERSERKAANRGFARQIFAGRARRRRALSVQKGAATRSAARSPSPGSRSRPAP